MICKTNNRSFAVIVALLAAISSSSSHAQTAAAAPVAAVRVDPIVTQLDHISIATAGKGSPVFLIPGLASPRAVWDGVVADLGKTHRVYLVQVNGFGGDAPGKNLDAGMLDGIVADLDGFMAKNKIKGAAVVGHSMGGLVTLMLAKAHPMDVSRAMIVDSLPYVGQIFNPAATVANMEPQAKAIRAQMVGSYGQPANPAYAEGTANGLALKPDSRAKVKAWVLAADPRVSGQALYEDMTTDLRPVMATIATPLTIVYPWSAAALPKARADAFYRAEYKDAPHAGFVDIGDSAHFVMLDQPEAFKSALIAFADAR